MAKAKDLLGQTFGRLKVIENAGRSHQNRILWKCECSCGNTTITNTKQLTTGATKSCGCLRKARRDITGERFGRLVAIRETDYWRGKSRVWECVCDCGKKHSTCIKSLTSGRAKSCGCLQKDIVTKSATKHGLSKTPEYAVHTAMKQRCFNSTCREWKDYGGRGIKVCERWSGEDGFINFYEDMGPRPSSDHSIDRIDVDGDYSPENCRWADDFQQNANKRNSYYVEYNGEILILHEAMRLSGRSNQYIKKHYPRIYPEKPDA